ncbi:MAG: nuclear transport factor 2 family protein [Parvibaculum sp.]|uniref:nuclear transport factor 2 family protein n=1 Tax=Parvibaculum sp. TaxID=2024848 RepID=UPI002851686D|nr:nuclear transport factor 2 family protein [Parvibaculum sp.]MDR3499662.1 nuclear transport factor 2 family protein [Parvibaculum sp.]
MAGKIPDMVLRWQAAWTSLDADRVAALYAEDGTHMSAVVAERMGIVDGTLKGRAEIRAYAAAARARLKSFRADIISTIAEDGRASIEYWRVLDGDDTARSRVVEILEWRKDEITACRVFHF